MFSVWRTRLRSPCAFPPNWFDWIDGEVAAGRAASRATALSRIARRAQRKQQAERDMARLLSSRPELPDPDEESRLEWTHTRQNWPDMGEPARVLYPERFQQHDDILHAQAIAWDHGYEAALAAANDEHRLPNPYVKTADASPSTAG
jgi:hypothetical protein